MCYIKLVHDFINAFKYILLYVKFENKSLKETQKKKGRGEGNIGREEKKLWVPHMNSCGTHL